MTPATIQDLLDLKRGHKSDGILRHRDCGGQMTYSFLLDRVGCKWCGTAWKWAWIHDRSLAVGKQGLYLWEPPVNYETGNVI